MSITARSPGPRTSRRSGPIWRHRALRPRPAGNRDRAVCISRGRRRVLGIARPVAGTGYTGERGRELGCSPRRTPSPSGTRSLERGVVPCGLGARDTLRLEVCYPLHGNDISTERTPIGGRPVGPAPPTSRSRRKHPSPPEAGGAHGEARRVRHGGSRDSPRGDADRGGGRGNGPARFRRCSTSASASVRPGGPRRARLRDHDRPARAASACAYRPKAVLQARGAVSGRG